MSIELKDAKSEEREYNLGQKLDKKEMAEKLNEDYSGQNLVGKD